MATMSHAMNDPSFRPPAEADSLILQIDAGCPHNRCSFCGMYRHVTYRRRPLDEVRRLVQAETRNDPGAQRVFLADGDVMCRPFDELKTILTWLDESLPGLARVSLYANGRSIAGKTDAELCALRALKLHTLYMGLESGDEEVLKRCRKAESAETMVAAGIRAQAAGLRMSVMVLLGLGGAGRSREHAVNTARALNRMQPRLLSALRVIPLAGTELFDDVRAGRFRPLTEHQVIRELYELVECLELRSTVFRANHASNVVPIEARLSRGRPRLLEALDHLLQSGILDTQSAGKQPMFL